MEQRGFIPNFKPYQRSVQNKIDNFGWGKFIQFFCVLRQFLGKSEAVPMREVEGVDKLAKMLGCKEGRLPDLFGVTVGCFL